MRVVRIGRRVIFSIPPNFLGAASACFTLEPRSANGFGLHRWRHGLLKRIMEKQPWEKSCNTFETPGEIAAGVFCCTKKPFFSFFSPPSHWDMGRTAEPPGRWAAASDAWMLRSRAATRRHPSPHGSAQGSQPLPFSPKYSPEITADQSQHPAPPPIAVGFLCFVVIGRWRVLPAAVGDARAKKNLYLPLDCKAGVRSRGIG